jgi:hypothetical protein
LPPIVLTDGGGWSGLDVAKTQNAKSSARRLHVDYMTRTERQACVLYILYSLDFLWFLVFRPLPHRPNKPRPKAR